MQEAAGNNDDDDEEEEEEEGEDEDEEAGDGVDDEAMEDQEAAAEEEDEEEEEEGDVNEPSFESNVASVTADFAMQNVILQMGLRLVTPDGRRIKEVHTWVLRCSACLATTREVHPCLWSLKPLQLLT